jgi:EmrB/QacA subfamily drug resistance transporter
MAAKALQSIATSFRDLDKVRSKVLRSGQSSLLLICAYTLCVAMESWTANAINIVLVDIAGNIGASPDETSWIITAYSAAAAVSITTSHSLCRMIGERRYILMASLLFGCASAGCAFSSTLASLVGFRILQGLAGGAFMSRTLVLLMTQFSPEKRSTPLRYYLLILFIIGRVAAPAVSGYLSDAFSWRSLFWVDALASLVAAGFFWIAPSKETLAPEPSTGKPRFDFLGASLLIIGITGIQLVMSRGEVDNWLGSALIRNALVVGVFANVGFVAWQVCPANHSPLVQMRHLMNRNLFVVVLLGVLLGTLFSSVLYAFPLYLRLSEVHSATQAGCLLSVVGIPMVALAVIAPKFVKMVQILGGRNMLLIGLSLQVLSSAWVIRQLTGNTPDIDLLPSLVLSGGFIFFTAVGLAVAGFAKVPLRKISNARTLYFGARQLGNSIGISLGTALLDRRQAFHSQRLLESYFLENRSTIVTQPVLPTVPSMQALSKAVMQQASVLSYQDMFLAAGIVAAIAMGCACFLPGSRQQTNSNAGDDPRVNVKDLTSAAELLALR